MSVELLRKTRALNGLLQASAGQAVSLQAMARVLGDNIDCSTHILDDGGRILGYYFPADFARDIMLDIVANGAAFPAAYCEFLSSIEQTRANLCEEGEACAFTLSGLCRRRDRRITVVPILGAGTRLGTMLLIGFGRDFSAADLVLAEYGATVIGMEVLHLRMGRLKDAARQLVSVQVAMEALSDSELDAIRRVLPVVQASQGLVVTTRVAKQMGCTRSVVVNALHKLKSAGVIESRSLGMKGTWVKLQNEDLLAEIERLWQQRRHRGRRAPVSPLVSAGHRTATGDGVPV